MTVLSLHTDRRPAQLRAGTPEDAEACGRICYEAFSARGAKHGFPPEVPSPEVATGFLTALFSDPRFYSVVAECDGEIVGSNFLDERTSVAGVGPVTVNPDAQNGGIGRVLMEDVMTRASQRGFASVRLLTAAYENRTVALYARLGFEVREPIACMQGGPISAGISGHRVRPATAADLDSCNRLCEWVHGHDRSGEVTDAIGRGTAVVVEHQGHLSGYATSRAFFGHSVGETTEDVKALIAAAPALDGLGILVPLRNAELFRWCLDNGLRVVQGMTLMSVGAYREPQGAYLPAVQY
jgi:GNAT superfamily N-acetyltransferase